MRIIGLIFALLLPAVAWGSGYNPALNSVVFPGGPFTTAGTGSLTINTSGATTLNVPSGTNTIAGMAFQAQGSVAITGGTIDGTAIGSTTLSTGKFTSITASSTINALGYLVNGSRNIASQTALSGNSYLFGNSPAGGTQDWCFCGNDNINTTAGGFSKVQITETASSSVTGNGGRSALGITATEGTSTTGAYPNFEGIQDTVFANAGLSGGSWIDGLGSNWAGDFYVALSGTGYSNLLYGAEFDVTVNSGAHVAVKNGINIVQESNDTARGYQEDAGFTIQNQLGDTTSWQNVIQLGGVKNGIWPAASDSCLVCAVFKQYGTTSISFTSNPAGRGFDTRSVNYTTAAWLSNGSEIDPNGNVYGIGLNLDGAIQDETSSVLSLTISVGGAFTTIPILTIQAPASGGTQATATVATMAGSSVVPFVSFGNAGTGYVTGDVVTPAGNTGTEPTYTVTATAGAVTNLTLTTAGSLTALAAQPESFTGGSGSGLTATLGFTIATVSLSGGSGYQVSPAPLVIVNPNLGTTEQAATILAVMSAPTYGNLALNPSGGTVQLGSGAFTANGSTSLALSNIGPTGAHATVQEWLTVKDAAGTVRYIPAF